jgi:hypothetical protein
MVRLSRMWLDVVSEQWRLLPLPVTSRSWMAFDCRMLTEFASFMRRTSAGIGRCLIAEQRLESSKRRVACGSVQHLAKRQRWGARI